MHCGVGTGVPDCRKGKLHDASRIAMMNINGKMKQTDFFMISSLEQSAS
jgi:hypothetical protein